MAGKAREKGLSPRLLKFAHELAKCRNQKEAALAVGVSEKSADSQASQWLKNPKVLAERDRISANAAELAGVTAAEILTGLKEIALSDPGQVLDEKGNILTLGEMKPEVRRCISSVEVAGDGSIRFKFWDKPKAFELLGKNLKLWTDKVEHSGTLTLEQLVAESMTTVDAEGDS